MSLFDLVGIPYDDNGDSPETGFRCYSLVRWVLNTELGIELPEHAPQAPAWPRYMTIYRPPLPKLQKYDVVMFAEIIEEIVNHIGILVSDTDFIHTGPLFGAVVCEPVDRYRDRIIAVGRPRT